MNQQKIILLFPDGVGVRNYLYSNVFKATTAELILFHNFDAQTIEAISENTSIKSNVTIPRYKESLKEKFLRELICLSRLHYNNKMVNNPSLLTNWNWNQKLFLKKIFYKSIEKIARYYKSYDAILALEKRYQKAIRKNRFYCNVKSIIENLEPNLIFCSHQRSLKAATIFAVAHDLGIKSATVIYSWDNLPKARMALRADRYLVWSSYMKNEMSIYYPEILSDSIYITGTPQFEFYQDNRYIMDKSTFYESYNLDCSKKIICFSGDDEKTSPDDPLYLKDIAEELVKSNLQDTFQIVLRRCPVDLSGRFDSIVKIYPDLIKEIPPSWHFKNARNWESIYPTINDLELLVSTVFYSDLVVNVGSTMAFDFAIFNKPCIFINYDQENKTVKEWFVNKIYQFQHFHSMPSKDAVIWLNNKNEIANKITKLSYDPAAMEQWKSIVIGDYEIASSTIIEKLKL
ncbi:hypothetical protein RCH18_001832 [Flavobacterium sp. PL11]|jgi:hypothetical protein|uniref:hypothetical protein n=1 Tax=Flavobacterium sp. PL11 TaxID=3071717 RepID=UPI002E0048C9|nr:hypothetical protein [Flavobacterium sp. PL11]